MTPRLRLRLALAAALMALGPGAASAAPAGPAHKPYNAALAKARFEKSWPKEAPHKLSDLYKFFTQALQEGLGADLRSEDVRITGQSWELMRDASFPEVELTLKPFETQGLHFDKGGFLFRKMDVDQQALAGWKLQVKQVREVQSRMVFTLRSLAKRLSDKAGAEVHLQADMEEQQVVLSGQGSFCRIPCAVEARCHFVWDEASKTLRLVPLQQSFGGHAVPSWLWGMGVSPVPAAPILDFGFSWIPFNIQEVHVGWDEVDLSTDW
ncbi:MAG TPA: hypothetical protein VK914_02900 [bacterium]|jgi:hypothetical protein|nr:hypothetical protein [bacterium]